MSLIREYFEHTRNCNKMKKDSTITKIGKSRRLIYKNCVIDIYELVFVFVERDRQPERIKL